MIITFISDTHSKHNRIFRNDLPGGDLLIHAGDISSMGYAHEIRNFCDWFTKLHKYTYKIFIAGNHDWGFELDNEKYRNLVNTYDNIIYLQDESVYIEDVKIYGSPWQPEFCNWAFNLPRNGKQLEKKWSLIPSDTDILITHGPAYGYLDKVEGDAFNLGCEILIDKIKKIKPKIHVFGHIHTGHGYSFDGSTNYLNASVLNEEYIYAQKPITIDWDKDTNEINFI